MSAALDPPDAHPSIPPRLGLRDRFRRWRLGRIADPAFQAWAAAFAPTRPLANRAGRRLYDLVAGFAYAQVLQACVELDLFRLLRHRDLSAAEIAARTPLSAEAAERLCRAAVALDLLALRRDGRFGLGDLGAALLGAPGVEEMVRHHPMFYRDLADPVGLLRGEGETELSRFWSYVRAAPVEEADAAVYSRLMAASQAMVAAETLAAVPLSDRRMLMDVGGGEGAFLVAALRAWPELRGRVLDLPPVAARAELQLCRAGLGGRAEAVAGSFRDDPLPEGADAISLVRVLYDHSDRTVRALLGKVHDALPPGGLLIVAEPMSGGRRPTRWGDAYFGLYTAAMTSGRPRSAAEIAALLREAGFLRVRRRRTRQPFVTGVVTAARL